MLTESEPGPNQTRKGRKRGLQNESPQNFFALAVCMQRIKPPHQIKATFENQMRSDFYWKDLDL